MVASASRRRHARAPIGGGGPPIGALQAQSQALDLDAALQRGNLRGHSKRTHSTALYVVTFACFLSPNGAPPAGVPTRLLTLYGRS